MSFPLDPIVAVSSPPGRSLRGLVRVSGDQLEQVLADLLVPVPAPRQMGRCRLRLGDGAELPALALFFQGPHSATGQDVLEIQVPGHPALLERVSQSVLAVLRSVQGAGRLAEAGEFTQRAFASGRIDLSAAEGIAATISAVSDGQLAAAAQLRTGRLGRWAQEQVLALGDALALVEAGIDFTDQDDVVAIAASDLGTRLEAVETQVRAMLARSGSWRQLQALPRVVLAGPPNAGKSTLFNALLGRERAVTSPVAGTTRDVLVEALTLGEPVGEILLVDIAGLDEPASGLDRAMQEAAAATLDQADLVVWMQAADQPAAPPPEFSAPRLLARSKADLGAAESAKAGLPVSAAAGTGLADLRRAMAAALGDRRASQVGGVMVLQQRHRDELGAAHAALVKLRERVGRCAGTGPLDEAEVVADLMRQALDHLGEIGGRMTRDEVIGRIFARFCVGK
ncbi:MAG: 50S ribosome-binding GTPase [Phycisphaerae bacterium]|nr:50S ribosome-binding GTPase [Phycisphaerae bacterium]